MTLLPLHIQFPLGRRICLWNKMAKKRWQVRDSRCYNAVVLHSFSPVSNFTKKESLGDCIYVSLCSTLFFSHKFYTPFHLPPFEKRKFMRVLSLMKIIKSMPCKL